MKHRRSETHNTSIDTTRLVHIEKPVYGGSFLARDEGKTVFVPLALPDEDVKVRIAEEKRGYAIAELSEIVKVAPQRVTANCQHFGVCGGCHYQHTDYDTQLAFKRMILRETLERGGVKVSREVEALSGNPWAYRNRIRLAFDQKGNIGYRGRKSHTLVPVEECPIAAPILMQAAFAVAETCRSIPSLRPSEIALFCNADETVLLTSLLVADSAKSGFDALIGAVNERVPALQGAELLASDRSGKATRQIARWGVNSLKYRVCGFDYTVGHGAFFQVNRWLIDALLERVTANYAGGVAWDLFAGVGLFARRLAKNFERVVAVESAPAATRELGANLNGTNAQCVAAESLTFLKRMKKTDPPDLIVVDPPRIGLGAETTSLLAETHAKALVYVSCDPATLARDLRALTSAGYQIESITLADLFPQTFHLETIVHLLRS
jgi:23S rRNA (uracil1939-C5)-methyltransferase